MSAAGGRSWIVHLACLLAPIVLLTCGEAIAGATPADLDPYITKAMGEWGVPGVAVGIVEADRVVVQRGYGRRQAGGEPVGAHTVFAIASLTKGMTAAALALLVDEGKLRWDDRVVTHLPGFTLADPALTHELTLRDLLAHRTGLAPEADALWSYMGYPQRELLARLPQLKATEGLRAGFSYHNVTYLVAGEVLARRAGAPWDEFVRRRLLRPLGMADASLHLMPEGPDAALPHSDRDGALRPIAPEDPDPVAPAAAVRASVTDMNRWMRFLLGKGVIDGKRLLSAERVAEIFTPQNLVPRSAIEHQIYPDGHFKAYGLGWMLQDYRGELLAWNTGGLVGMACSIALLPRRGIGVVVLSNGPRVSLPEALVFRVIDSYLGAPPRDWSAERLAHSLARRARQRAAEASRPRVAGTRPSLSPGRYAGSYEEPLLGAVLVESKGERLALRMGRGQRGQLSHWHHDSFLVTWNNPEFGTSLATFQLDGAGVPARLLIEELGEFTRAPTAGRATP